MSSPLIWFSALPPSDLLKKEYSAITGILSSFLSSRATTSPVQGILEPKVHKPCLGYIVFLDHHSYLLSDALDTLLCLPTGKPFSLPSVTTHLPPGLWLVMWPAYAKFPNILFFPNTFPILPAVSGLACLLYHWWDTGSEYPHLFRIVFLKIYWLWLDNNKQY